MKNLGNFLVLFALVSGLVSSSVYAAPAAPSTSTNEVRDSMNVYVAPVGILIGNANVGVDFGVNDTIAVGPTIGYSRLFAGSYSAQQLFLGANADFFFNHRRFTDGIFLNAGLSFQYSSLNSSSGAGVGLSTNFGYGWFWSGGFNIMLAGGIAFSSSAGALNGYSVSYLAPNLMFQLGWTF